MRSGRRKEKSILTRFIVSVGIVLAISVAVIAAFLWWYTARTLDQYHDSLLQQCQLAGKNAGSDIHALLEQSKIPVYREPAGHDTSYLRQLRQSVHESSVSEAYYNAFLSTAKLIYFGNPSVHSAYSVNQNLMSVSWEPAAKGYTPEIDPELWKAETDAARGSGVFLGAIELDDGSYVYAVSRAMIAVPHTEIIGYFILTEEISVLQDTCSSMLSYPNQQYWITDQTGQIISSADPGQIGQSCRALFGDRAFETLLRDRKAAAGGRRGRLLLAAEQLQGTDWLVVTAVESRYITAELSELLLGMSAVIFLLFAAAAAVAIREFYRNVVKPVNSLISTMQEAGVITEPLSGSCNEVNVLGSSYEQLNHVIADLKKEKLFATLHKNRIEIEFLQIQISPHFLYNTLESIRMMAEINGDEASVEMICALSKILRYSIGTSDKVTTLRNELAIARDYVFLQKKQLSVIEAFRIDIPKQYADTLVPKLSLQPIIENAITHAFSNPGIICLSCTDTGEHFQIAVSDNGCGIPEQRLAQLRRSLDGTGEHSGSIGLQNVHRRLKLLFGPDCGLQIESQWGKGTTVYLNLPPVGGKA